MERNQQVWLICAAVRRNDLIKMSKGIPLIKSRASEERQLCVFQLPVLKLHFLPVVKPNKALAIKLLNKTTSLYPTEILFNWGNILLIRPEVAVPGSFHLDYMNIKVILQTVRWSGEMSRFNTTRWQTPTWNASWQRLLFSTSLQRAAYEWQSPYCVTSTCALLWPSGSLMAS